MTYKHPDIWGMMDEDDLMWLYENACKMNSIVEIGSWGGRSTHALLTGCKGTVHAVDPFKGGTHERDWNKENSDIVYNDFMNNVGHFKNLVLKKMHSAEAVGDFHDNSIDMVFIDGDHEYDFVIEDITIWLPKTVKLICGHDCKYSPVKKAVGELLGDHKITSENIWYKEL